jgi:hypothetical protein
MSRILTLCVLLSAAIPAATFAQAPPKEFVEGFWNVGMPAALWHSPLIVVCRVQCEVNRRVGDDDRGHWDRSGKLVLVQVLKGKTDATSFRFESRLEYARFSAFDNPDPNTADPWDYEDVRDKSLVLLVGKESAKGERFELSRLEFGCRGDGYYTLSGVADPLIPAVKVLAGILAKPPKDRMEGMLAAVESKNTVLARVAAWYVTDPKTGRTIPALKQAEILRAFLIDRVQPFRLRGELLKRTKELVGKPDAATVVLDTWTRVYADPKMHGQLRETALKLIKVGLVAYKAEPARLKSLKEALADPAKAVAYKPKGMRLTCRRSVIQFPENSEQLAKLRQEILDGLAAE